MRTVVISPHNVVNFFEGGGHFWVYMQYVQGLRQLGCEVYWLENFHSSGNAEQDAAVLSAFTARMKPFGLDEKLILYMSNEEAGTSDVAFKYIGITRSEAEKIFDQADLLLNFHYAIEPALLSYFRYTALVDIDPGLLQFWISRGQLSVAPHNSYFTTGETVGTPAALFPDCGLPWIQIRPVVCLNRWPYMYNRHNEAFTTVSGWDSKNWIVDPKADPKVVYENTKRVSFLQFKELPHKTNQTLELALYLGDGDMDDRRIMEGHGWRIRHSCEVASTPEQYQSYIQGSRGEFSCAKRSCMNFQNAWISDRTLCYLASGKPVVVQNTGPSSYLPNGEGMFRFATLEEAADALATINANYERHCRSAREICETYFDAKQVLAKILSFVP